MNRLKVMLYFLMCLGFVAGGVGMFFANPTRRHSELELKIIGGLCILFFGLGMLVFAIQLFKKGLIISEKGIEDDCSFISLGLIKWEVIGRINIVTEANQDLLIIPMNSEEKDFYLKKVKNPLKKWLMKINLKKYGYTIPINFLKIKPKELEIILIKKHPFYKKR